LVIPWVRHVALKAVAGSGLADLCRPFIRDSAIVFAFHRFADHESGVAGFEPQTLRALLKHLRRKRYRVLDVRAILDALRNGGPPLAGAVAFTMDDGYREQAAVAGPVFAEFDCPATIFVVTGFLDGFTWLWWDQVDHVFRQTTRQVVSVETLDGPHSYSVGDVPSANAARADFADYCKRIPEAAKAEAVQQLARAAEVDLPTHPPPAYAPMSWDELRAAERRGMTFGPHTVTHPILSRTDDAQSRREIRESWARVRAEARDPQPIFAYPNGKPPDYGDREIGTLREAGIEGAMTCTLAHATRRRFARSSDGAYSIPRFAPPPTTAHLIQFVSGLERLKLLIRGAE